MNKGFRLIIESVAVVAAALMIMSCATAQERAARREQTQQMVIDGVTQRRLHIDVNSMSTLRYGTRMVSGGFFLELRGDTLNSYLPYLGQVYYSPVVSTPQGLNFEEPLLGYYVSHPKASTWRIDMVARTREDQFHYIVDVYDNGKAYIRVQGQNRDAISFDGDCTELTR